MKYKDCSLHVKRLNVEDITTSEKTAVIKNLIAFRPNHYKTTCSSSLNFCKTISRLNCTLLINTDTLDSILNECIHLEMSNVNQMPAKTNILPISGQLRCFLCYVFFVSALLLVALLYRGVAAFWSRCVNFK